MAHSDGRRPALGADFAYVDDDTVHSVKFNYTRSAGTKNK